MSEYWVSKKKYYCKYCEIYIADDAPSRKQHETGLRHQGNVERYIRGIYKAGEKRKHDLEEEKREIARIEKVAEAAYQQDVAAGRVKPGSSRPAVASSSAAPATETKKTAAPKPSNPYANYTTAESLGFTDPDAERAKAEAERRRTQGIVGDWEVVEEVVPPQLGEEQEREHGAREAGAAGESQTGSKRPAETLADEEDTRGWKLRRKTANVGLGDLYDPDTLPIKLKPKKEEQVEAMSASTDGVGPSLGGTEMPKWSARGWNKPGTSSSMATLKEEAREDDADVGGTAGDILAQLADEPIQPSEVPIVPVKTEPVKTEDVKSEPVQPDIPPPPAASLFKKRKAPAGGGARGGRRI